MATMTVPALAPEKARALRQGLVIPAHPLALTAERRLDERRQRALSRYYLAAWAGGLAVAVHTTQFAIREPRVGLLRPVLELAAAVAREAHGRAPLAAANGATGSGPNAPGAAEPVMVAGVVGRTDQALREAQLAADLGYDCLLVQLGAFGDAPDDVLIEHCRRLAEVRPLFGFYLQPAVGGRVLSYAFWRRFAELANVVAIKIAPFNRYQTLDVVRGVADSGRADQVALYTGNDDHILLDLLTPFPVGVGQGTVAAGAINGAATTLPSGGARGGSGEQTTLRVVGGLLGHWAAWTQRAAEHLQLAHRLVAEGAPVTPDVLRLANEITDANAALFDPQHGFTGCIAGIHEVLRRQGLLVGRWCLDEHEGLSPGQMAEIDRVCAAYPHLTDDAFVAEHLDDWLR